MTVAVGAQTLALAVTGEDWVVTVGISWVDIVFDSFLERRGRFESNHL